MAYLPDHLLVAADDDGPARRLAEGADLLVHDGQYLDAESATASNYGHSTLSAVLAFADRCGVEALVLTHHAPMRTDAALDELARAVTTTPAGRPVHIATQGEVLPVGCSSRVGSARARPAE